MASALVNNVGVTPEKFLDCRPPSSSAAFSPFGWLSPQVSISLDDGSPSKVKNLPIGTEEKKSGGSGAGSESPVFDFEFRLDDDPVVMLPADELFSDGKLVPLHLASVRANLGGEGKDVVDLGVKSVEAEEKRREEVVASIDPYLLSPKAPRCSSRWRDLLGLKKAAAAAAAAAAKPRSNQKVREVAVTAPTTKAVSSYNHSVRGGALKHFLLRNQNKSSSNSDSSLVLPLLRDSESDTVSISARLSLSSTSSSGVDHDHDDLPRLSLDSDKSRNPARLRLVSRPQQRSLTDPIKHPIPDHPAVRVGRSQVHRATADVAIPPRGASVDSPRMNSYGKIVFQSLERSSSSPSTFNGGPRLKHRGVERSYSANVRITPVLNVPVCSLRGSSKNVFGLGHLFSSPQKRDNNTGKSSGNGGGGRSHRQIKEGVTGN